jgi:hypothetical protein
MKNMEVGRKMTEKDGLDADFGRVIDMSCGVFIFLFRISSSQHMLHFSFPL